MRELNDNLAHFMRAIVHGDELSTQVSTAYLNYSVATGIDIYRNNYRGNLHDVLAGAYPVIQQLVGDDFFRLLTRRFIEQHPSRNANLHHYGAEMASFVASFAPAQQLVYLPDMAALEWACHIAYFAEDAPALDLGKLAQIPPEHYAELILHIHPACQMVRSRYPITVIWQAHQVGMGSDFQIDLDSGASIALVSNKKGVVQVSELADADADWLQAIQARVALGAATTATLERYPKFDLQTALLKLAAQNVLTDFDFGAAP